jgi:hypothetical protein
VAGISFNGEPDYNLKMKTRRTLLENVFRSHTRSIPPIAGSLVLLVCLMASGEDMQTHSYSAGQVKNAPGETTNSFASETRQTTTKRILLAKKKKKAPLAPPPVEPFDLKGIKLGCTLSEFSTSSPFKDTPAADRANTTLLSVTKQRLFELNKQRSEPYTVATVEPDALQFRFVQKDGQWRLYKITVEFSSKQADTVLAGLNGRYGKPMSLERIAKRSAGGSEIQSRDGVWDNEVSQIYFRETAGQIGKADLVYVHKELENAGLGPAKNSPDSNRPGDSQKQPAKDL